MPRKKNRIGYDLRSDAKQKEETAGDRLKKALFEYRKNPIKHKEKKENV